MEYTLRIWRRRPGEPVGDYAATRPYDETRYVDLPEDLDAARAEVILRGYASGGDTFRIETKERA